MQVPGVLRVVEADAIAYRRVWKGSAFSSFVTPALFLVAMGLGLGSLVDRGAGAPGFEGLSYVSFLAPGLLVASAMQSGAAQGSFPVIAGMKWTRTYHSVVASPVGTGGLLGGHFIWSGLRVLMVSVIFGAVAAALGAISPVAVLALAPIGILIGLATVAPMTAFTANRDNTEALTAVFRFGITPMYLFSGAFFPITQLPDWLQAVATLTPLWHAVELARRVALGYDSALPAWQHVGYLVLLIVVGAAMAYRLFARRLNV
ncbi:MAG: ABC transporter [Acidimicrobiia bacterium]|nr:ABC transporter [Acidimicrobiia bacterium]MYF84219.1 ABC transporter [Acidimicrobiia bacterium]